MTDGSGLPEYRFRNLDAGRRRGPADHLISITGDSTVSGKLAVNRADNMTDRQRQQGAVVVRLRRHLTDQGGLRYALDLADRVDATAHWRDEPDAGENVAADSDWHLEDGGAQMPAMALGRRRRPAPARSLAELPGIGLFDPLGEM